MPENEIQVHYMDAAPGLNPQDLTELGALLSTTGLSTMESRAFIAEVQQVTAQVALTMAPKLLEKVHSVQSARLSEMYNSIRLLPQMMGYVSRDRVLAIIQAIASRPPRQ